MQSVGQILRHAREACGRTLEQVNSSTRIPVKVLEAIETDDLSAIHSAFLYRSFVRQMAASVNLDTAELDSSLQTAANRIPAPLMPGEGAAAPPKVAALRIGRKRKSRLLYSLSSFAMALMVCSALYALWQNEKSKLPGAWHSLVGTSHKETNPPPAQVTADPKEPNDHPAVPQHDPDVAQADAAGFTLELSATEPAWLSIIADGKQSFKGILERAETKVLEGRRTARIRTGNAGGVNVVFNGKSLGPLGPRGQVRTVLFTRNNYEVLLDSPTRVSLLNFSQTAAMAQFPPSLEVLPGL
ncbi:MAG: DUF4115 domain-containing protein [Acidobacteriota bacterium]|nr:DUF4115 domain-containing protein [Acidobacteriota bacterium]